MQANVFSHLPSDRTHFLFIMLSLQLNFFFLQLVPCTQQLFKDTAALSIKFWQRCVVMGVHRRWATPNRWLTELWHPGPLLTHSFPPRAMPHPAGWDRRSSGFSYSQDTRAIKLGREENRGAPPHLQPQLALSNWDSDVVWSNIIQAKTGSL